MISLLRAIAVVLLAWGIAAVSLAQDDERGLRVHSDRALDGYTLIAPLHDDKVYLIDNDGRVVNEWDAGQLTREAHLLDNGRILVVREPSVPIDESLFDLGYPRDGAVVEYTWEGDIVWERAFVGAEQRHHHGIDIMPNGNVLALLWDYHSLDEAIAMGLDPDIVAANFQDFDVFLPDVVVEIDNPSGEIVWTWDAWDHLIQDRDENLPNFGEPAANPQRIDINYQQYYLKDIPIEWSSGPHDWMHSNMVNYNPELGQIVISVLRFDEVWIFNHSDTSEEAAGPAGDLLFRWGNPFAYGRGDMTADTEAISTA